ncbi:MAG: hypothetical protein A3D87_08245 [Omnitrophica WOR_2 bacterium RIFCSPHIGHO2_02_FULL_50_17]|nr:MAG: hypothetical protein A3D87_08245 [Omnitrophica WOR_2 bacterium RIFCSPHIGHO2_02_FULL_50_17]
MLLIGSRLIGSKAIKSRNMADINKRVGKKIRYYREKKRLTQEALAFEADLHRAYVGQIERGEKNIGIQNLEKIAKALNIKASKFFAD